MRRKRPEDTVKRFRLDQTEHLAVPARKAARWASDRKETLRGWDGDVPTGMHDRAADNWRALLAIADTAGADWPEPPRIVSSIEPHPQYQSNPQESWCYPLSALGAYREWLQNVYIEGGKFSTYLQGNVPRGELAPSVAQLAISTSVPAQIEHRP